MCYIAKINRKPSIDYDLLKKIAKIESSPKAMLNRPKDPEKDEDEEPGMKQFGYTDFFTDPSLRLPTIYQMTIMCSTAMTYYGISFNVKNMQGSIYIIVMLLGLSDAIGYPSALLVCNR